MIVDTECTSALRASDGFILADGEEDGVVPIDKWVKISLLTSEPAAFHGKNSRVDGETGASNDTLLVLCEYSRVSTTRSENDEISCKFTREKTMMGSARVPSRSIWRGSREKASSPLSLWRSSNRSRPVACSMSVGTSPVFPPGPVPNHASRQSTAHTPSNVRLLTEDGRLDVGVAGEGGEESASGLNAGEGARDNGAKGDSGEHVD